MTQKKWLCNLSILYFFICHTHFLKIGTHVRAATTLNVHILVERSIKTINMAQQPCSPDCNVSHTPCEVQKHKFGTARSIHSHFYTAPHHKKKGAKSRESDLWFVRARRSIMCERTHEWEWDAVFGCQKKLRCKWNVEKKTRWNANI